MTPQEMEESVADLAIVGAVVSGVARIFGRGGGGSGKTHDRIRAQKAARARQLKKIRELEAKRRTPVYEVPATYHTQPQPVIIAPPLGTGEVNGLLTLIQYGVQMYEANELARAAEANARAAAAWYDQPIVLGPPGPYEVGSYYGVNFPLLAGSRQDPRGMRRPDQYQRRA